MSLYFAMFVVLFVSQHLESCASVPGKYSKHDKQELLKEILERYFLHPNTYLNRSRKIAFSAKLTSKLSNMKLGQPIRFDKVLTNDGSGYNPSTGIFTAPEPGMYVFSWTFLTYSKEHAHVFLYQNGTLVWQSYADDTGTSSETGGATVTLNLARKDKIQLRSGSNGGYLYNSYCGFTGFSLY